MHWDPAGTALHLDKAEANACLEPDGLMLFSQLLQSHSMLHLLFSYCRQGLGLVQSTNVRNIIEALNKCWKKFWPGQRFCACKLQQQEFCPFIQPYFARSFCYAD